MKPSQEGGDIDQSGNPIPLLTSTFLLLPFVILQLLNECFSVSLIPLKIVPHWITRKSALLQYGKLCWCCWLPGRGLCSCLLVGKCDSNILPDLSACLNFCHRKRLSWYDWMALTYKVEQELLYLIPYTCWVCQMSPSTTPCCLGAALRLWHPFTSGWEEMSHLPGSVCGQRPDPARGGRGSTCTPARLWSVSKSSSRFAETPPSWGMHLPGQEVRAAAGPRCCHGTRKGSLAWVLAGTCKRKGRDFPRGLPR